MPDYRRPGIAGGTYFITQVTYQRQPWLCHDIGRHAGFIRKTGVNAPLSLSWMSDGSDGAFACRNAPYKIRDRTCFYRDQSYFDCSESSNGLYNDNYCLSKTYTCFDRSSFD